MAICKLMILDFQDGIGRYDEDGRERYDVSDLEAGLHYAEGLLEMGYVEEPTDYFDLKAFVKWVKQSL